MTKHNLKIISLHDAQAECLCGWNFVYTGEMRREEIYAEYKRHLDLVVDYTEKYSITSVENWHKYVETGDNELLNDVHYWLEKGEVNGRMDGDYNVVIAWEGGSVECRILT